MRVEKIQFKWQIQCQVEMLGTIFPNHCRCAGRQQRANSYSRFLYATSLGPMADSRELQSLIYKSKHQIFLIHPREFIAFSCHVFVLLSIVKVPSTHIYTKVVTYFSLQIIPLYTSLLNTVHGC